MVSTNSQKLFINTQVIYKKYYHTKLYGNFIFLFFSERKNGTSLERLGLQDPFYGSGKNPLVLSITLISSVLHTTGGDWITTQPKTPQT